MRTATGKLVLLLVALAATAVHQAYSAGADEGGLVVEEPIPDSVLAETELVPAQMQFLPGEFGTRCGPCGPVWYFEAQGLALKRDASGDRTFQVLIERVWDQELVEVPDPADPSQTIFELQWVSTDTVTPVLGTQDLDFGFQYGGRALVGRTLGNCHAFEVSYFQVTDWDEMAAVRDDTEFVPDIAAPGDPPDPDFANPFPASLFSPFSDFGNPPIEELDYNNLAQIRYTSSLDNIEWNLRRWLPMPPDSPLQVSLLVGGRYMNVDEAFFYYTESAVPFDPTTTSVITQTANTLLGVQAGAQFEYHVEPCWWIDCEIKGAVFSNSAKQLTAYDHQGDPGDPYVATTAFTREEDTSAFALDLRLTGTWMVTPCLAVCGGYQALWVDGLALASENFSDDIDILMLGPATLVDTGKVVYHGPHLGATWRW